MRTILLLSVLLFSCQPNGKQQQITETDKPETKPVRQRVAGQKVIHVYVALCDNKYQGIVPVPEKIGNGKHPANNLYWGCAFGVKTFFSNSNEWELQKGFTSNIFAPILERCVFKNHLTNTWLVADAYDGQFIKACTEKFLSACAGSFNDSVILKDGSKIFAGGSSHLLAYIGHDGLMDFSINKTFAAVDSSKRESIILACISKTFFAPLLKQTAAKPILWSTGLMAPEAYVLHDALSAWVKNQPVETIRSNAAAAYSKYQKCSIKAARNLLVSGW